MIQDSDSNGLKNESEEQSHTLLKAPPPPRVEACHSKFTASLRYLSGNILLVMNREREKHHESELREQRSGRLVSSLSSPRTVSAENSEVNVCISL